MAERVKADLILANDPDADRLAVVVRNGDGGLQALSGDEVGVLLGHYLLSHGPKVAKPLVITTIVSSSQLKQIARDLGAYFDETLTGFKWIANRALDRAREEGTTFVFGYEEALGYCVDDVTRDKDGISAALLFADLVVWCRQRGMTALQYLEQIQQKHGLFVSKQRSFTFSGPTGVQTINAIMEGFRGLSLDRIGAAKVLATKDYLKGQDHVPRSNVLAYELSGGSRVTLRPSGTEPKVKYYFEHREDVLKNESLASAKERAKRHLLDLEEAALALAKRFQ
jgi:phosphomannomutase